MEKNFTDKVIVITGSTFGIGKSTAIEFAKRGAKVVLSDYVEDQDTLKIIQENQGDAIFVKCDVSKEEDVKNLIKETIKKYGRLDYAFNNAGIEGTPAPATDCSNDNWERTININLTGVWYCMKYQIPEMLKSGGALS